MLEVCGSSLLWRFVLVGGFGQVACQGFLVREVCISCLVIRAGSLASEVSSSEFWGICGFSMALGSLSFNA